MEQMEAEEVLRRELAALPERLRLPLVLYYYDGKSDRRRRAVPGSAAGDGPQAHSGGPGSTARRVAPEDRPRPAGRRPRPDPARPGALASSSTSPDRPSPVRPASSRPRSWSGPSPRSRSPRSGSVDPGRRPAHGGRENAEEDVAELDAPVEGSTPRSTRARGRRGRSRLRRGPGPHRVRRDPRDRAIHRHPEPAGRHQRAVDRPARAAALARASRDDRNRRRLRALSPESGPLRRRGPGLQGRSRGLRSHRDRRGTDEDATLDLWVERAYLRLGLGGGRPWAAMIGLGLEVIAEGTGVAQRLNTDSQGRFRTPEPLAAGSVGLSATTQVSGMLPWGLRSLPLSEVLAGTDDVAHLELVFPWNGRLRGRVVDDRDRPQAGARRGRQGPGHGVLLAHGPGGRAPGKPRHDRSRRSL